MRPKKPSNRDIPLRMIKRQRRLKSGKIWIGYYYDGRDENGKRVEIPLGTDLDEAKVEWARLERIKIPLSNRLMAGLFDRYQREIIPSKAPRTQKDNLKELANLRKAFADAPIEAITPQVIAQYRDARTAKTRGNREIALLSHIFNIAREWGFTEKENPCSRVRRNKEKIRDYYAADDVWEAVYAKAVLELQHAMDLAYLIGQRPADVLKVETSDITKDYLLIAQGKTTKKLRVKLHNEQKLTSLGLFINNLMEFRKQAGIQSKRLITNAQGLRMSQGMLRNRWDEARKSAAEEAETMGDIAFAERIRKFQFRDIRPKAATEIEDLSVASKLLGHTNEAITKQVYRRLGEVVDPTK